MLLYVSVLTTRCGACRYGHIVYLCVDMILIRQIILLNIVYYIVSNDAEKMVNSLYSPRRQLTTADILYLYKCHTRQTAYCYHIGAGSTPYTFKCLNRFQN